jgi:hypothetical protein
MKHPCTKLNKRRGVSPQIPKSVNSREVARLQKIVDQQSERIMSLEEELTSVLRELVSLREDF